MLDGSKITVSIGQRNYDIDTTNILFIGGGVFEGLNDVIAKRAGKVTSNGIGFGAPKKEDVKVSTKMAISEDLIKFGFTPEFIGRFATIAVLEDLGEDDLVNIMTTAKDSITSQYLKLFKLSGIDLKFDKKLLKEIAGVASGKGTGARALKTLLDAEMKEIMFTLPGSGVTEYTVKSKSTKKGGKKDVGKTKED